MTSTSPARPVTLANGGYVCKHCGGSVDSEGYSDGGLVEDDDTEQDKELEEQEKRALFDRAVRSRK